MSIPDLDTLAEQVWTYVERIESSTARLAGSAERLAGSAEPRRLGGHSRIWASASRVAGRICPAARPDLGLLRRTS